jgi:hypothetical protein
VRHPSQRYSAILGGQLHGPLQPPPPFSAYNGALSTYERLGFTRHRQIGKHRWVVTTLVKPRPA